MQQWHCSSVSPWQDGLPEPLLRVLDSHSVMRLTRACRAWRESLNRAPLTKPVRIGGDTEPCRDFAGAWLARNLHRTQDLALVGWREAAFPPDLLTAAPANGLVKLKFSDCDAPQLPSLSTCTALQKLEITECRYLTGLPPLDSLTQLTRLKLRDNGRPIDLWRRVPLPRLPTLASCTALKELIVKQSSHRRAGWLSTTVVLPELPPLPELTTLCLEDCLFESGCRFEAGFPQLVVLHVERCSVTASQLLFLTTCTALAELRISSCNRWTEEPFLPALSALPALSSLCLVGFDSAERLPSLAGLSRLTSLDVDDVTWYTDQLAPIADLTSLVELKIRKIYDLIELPSLASCGQLRSLHVDGCSKLQALPDLSRCTQLESLQLWDCPELQALPDLSGCTQLEDLCLSCMIRLQELPSLASCAQLQSLHVECCGKLQALPDLSRCTQLQSLQLRDCPKLEHLPGLAACRGQLHTFKIYSCKLLADSRSGY